MNLGTRSLLDFIDAPIIVGDPDGRVVYLNAAFSTFFKISTDDPLGGLMATLFEGGAREAVLQAVADICRGGGSIRFALSVDGTGFSALASPISDATDRVGVVILLTEELSGDDRLIACSREFQQPLDDLMRCLTEIAEQVGGRHPQRYRLLMDDAENAVELLRKRADELLSMLSHPSRDR